MSVSMASGCNQNMLKSKKEKIFNSRSHHGKRVQDWRIATGDQVKIKSNILYTPFYSRTVALWFQVRSQEFEKKTKCAPLENHEAAKFLDANAPSRPNMAKSTALTQPFCDISAMRNMANL